MTSTINILTNKRNELLNTNRQSQWLIYYFSAIAVKLTLMSEEKLRFHDRDGDLYSTIHFFYLICS
jgi:hypothetical protein